MTANRDGAGRRPHGEIAFAGQSQIVAPKGDPIYRGPADRDDLAVVEVDIELARDKRIAARNDVLANRRPAFYGPITESAGM
ncbi:MAG: hypothetical protein H8D77_00015 [Chloroflexi bacterium]|nr:hypothetical protein [Chloroflexota bacterium]